MFSIGGEQEVQVANEGFLKKTMLLCEFRLVMLCYRLTSEHSVLRETAGTAREALSYRNPVRPDEGEAVKCSCGLHRDREKVVSDSALI